MQLKNVSNKNFLVFAELHVSIFLNLKKKKKNCFLTQDGLDFSYVKNIFRDLRIWEHVAHQIPKELYLKYFLIALPDKLMF